MKSTTFILGLLCSLLSNSQPKQLQPGDTIPVTILASITTNRQQDTSNELLILDFFATWCTSCLKRFPLLDSLEQEFNGQLKVILVPSNKRDDEKRIAAFLQKRKKPTGEDWSFPILVGDTLLEQHFPHRILPHYVWLYRGRVAAITSSAAITAQNIQAILNGQQLLLPVKKDPVSIFIP